MEEQLTSYSSRVAIAGVEIDKPRRILKIVLYEYVSHPEVNALLCRSRNKRP